MPRSNKKKFSQRTPGRPPPEPPPENQICSSEIAIMLNKETAIMISRAISSAQKHGIKLKAGRPNPGTGDCAFEAAIFNNNDRACFQQKFLNSIDWYRKIFATDMANRTLHSPYNTLPPSEWLRGWSEMLESGAYERGIFGDLMVPGIACGLKKVILIFNTNPASPHDPIYVVNPSNFNVQPDTEIPIVLSYNMSHYESMEPITENDVQATINLVREYEAGRYIYSKKDIPFLISTDSKLQLISSSPKLDKDIETKRQTLLDKEPKKTKQYNAREMRRTKEINKTEDTNDEINLEDIDD